LHDLAVSLIERARIQQESVQHELWQRTEEMQKSIISSISHDLRTPLSRIMGEATHFLQEDISWDDETVRTAFQNIEHEAHRLDRFVRDLLDMSRIEGGKLKPKKVLCYIDGLIYETLEYMQPALQGRSVKMRVPDLPPLEIDRTCIGQVVQNLLENAMHYTPVDSTIEITATTDNKQVLISVADRGPGIKPGDEERIFDKFYRSKLTHPTDTGMGLGLAICRGLVEAHGGRIWAKNRIEGGAIFQFTLPM
jgi:two-component system sensor histidine kinase KdpD